VNRLAQFLHYAQKVFALKTVLRGVRAARPFAQIPTTPVLLTLVLGVVLRISSYLDLAQQTKRRRWQHLCGLQAALSDDTLEYVTERLELEDLRQALASVAKTLKQNKALESCKINGLLFVSLDANEHFKSRSRCCERCCQRQVEETDAEGHKHKVTEYYHRYVFAQINGPKINVLLDLEPIRPGEEECSAALRLLGRVRRIYGPRFFDAITVDAWYVQGPFLRAVQKLGWLWVVVLKREDMEVYQEAQQLSQGQKPLQTFEDKERRRQVRLWEVKDLHFSKEYGQPVRVVRSEEQWVEQRVRGGCKRREPQQSQWLWAASAKLDGYAGQVIYQAGHRRWGIENKAFNELTQAYHLEHCYHHEPTSMLAQMLILILGFTLFTAFAYLQCKLVRWGELTAKALTKELDLALEEDLPWDQWFHSG
jgi:Transposase DDE domain